MSSSPRLFPGRPTKEGTQRAIQAFLAVLQDVRWAPAALLVMGWGRGEALGLAVGCAVYVALGLVAMRHRGLSVIAFVALVEAYFLASAQFGPRVARYEFVGWGVLMGCLCATGLLCIPTGAVRSVVGAARVFGWLVLLSGSAALVASERFGLWILAPSAWVAAQLLLAPKHPKHSKYSWELAKNVAVGAGVGALGLLLLMVNVLSLWVLFPRNTSHDPSISRAITGTPRASLGPPTAVMFTAMV